MRSNITQKVTRKLMSLFDQTRRKFYWYFGSQQKRSRPKNIDSCYSLEVTDSMQHSHEELGSNELPRILILTPVKNAIRFLPKYFDNLLSLSYPHQNISVGFIESDSIDRTYEYLQESIIHIEGTFRRTILCKRDYNFQTSLPRWHTDIQFKRRSILAKNRNYLLSQALENEVWVLWLDVDTSSYPVDIIQRLLATGKKIVVPHCVYETSNLTFDLNTFKFKPGAANRNWYAYMVDGIIQSPKGLGRYYLQDLQQHSIIEVDSVGGTALLILADLLREGLCFPTYSYKGYIETEGLAMMAKDMGYTCWGLPNLKVTHGDHLV